MLSCSTLVIHATSQSDSYSVFQYVSQSASEEESCAVHQPACQEVSHSLTPSIESITEAVTQSVHQPLTQSVFEATGSILINPWHAGQRAGPADEVVVSVLSASGVVTLSPQRGPALFEPDVWRQASPAVRLHPHPCTPPALLCLSAAARPAEKAAAHVRWSWDVPLDGSLLHFSIFIPAPPITLLSSCPSPPLPRGIPPSIHSPLSLPSPFIFTPPSLFGPLPLSASLRGKSAACVAWQHACSHRFPSSPLFYPTSSFPLHSHPILSICEILFLISTTSPLSFSSFHPLSLSLSPPASNHSPSISFTACLHSYFALQPPSLPPPLLLSSSAGLRSSEQVLSPFDLGAFGLMLSAQLLKQLPLPDASQFGAGAVTYTHTHTHTNSQTYTHSDSSVRSG